MNEKAVKMREKLEEQFDVLLDRSKKCEPEYLKDLTQSMIDIYTILYHKGY